MLKIDLWKVLGAVWAAEEDWHLVSLGLAAGSVPSWKGASANTAALHLEGLNYKSSLMQSDFKQIEALVQQVITEAAAVDAANGT